MNRGPVGEPFHNSLHNLIKARVVPGVRLGMFLGGGFIVLWEHGSFLDCNYPNDSGEAVMPGGAGWDCIVSMIIGT